MGLPMTYMNDAKGANQEKANQEKKDKMSYRANIKKQATLLAEMLINSPEYIQFLQAREKLEADSEQTNMLNELRQRQMALSVAAMAGEEQEAADDFDKMYFALINNPIISDYLFAEGRLFHLISDVEEVFNKKLEIWHMPEIVEAYEPDELLN